MIKYLLLFIILSLPANAAIVTYEQAIKAKNNGQHELAEDLFKQLINKNNKNADYLFQLGLVQRYQQKTDLAMASQLKAIKLSPKNYDIMLEIARLNSWQKNYDEAESWINKVLKNKPNYPGTKELAEFIERGRNAPPDPKSFKWQLSFGYENSDFSRRPQPNWHQYFLQLSRRINDNTLLNLRTENIERFKSHNEYYEIGIAQIFNQAFNGNFSIGHTPDSVFFPKIRIKAGGEARILYKHNYVGNSWLTAQVQHDRYQDQVNITSITPGLRYQLHDDWFIQAKHINIIDENDEHLKGWSSRLDWQTPIDRLGLFAGLSDAPETENGVTIDTKSRFLGLSYGITHNVTFYASYARDDRENSFIRNIISTSMLVKF